MATPGGGSGRAVTVTVAESHLASIKEVVARLREAGMEVEQVLPAIGVITGTVAASSLAALSAVDGVASIERQTQFRIPPPDAEVQ